MPFLATALAVSALCLIVAQVWFEVRYAHVLPFVVGAFGAYTAAYRVYQVVSLPVNFAGRGFDLAAHTSLVPRRPRHYPSVDIFLPICGEPIEVLRTPGPAYSSWSRPTRVRPRSMCWMTAPATRRRRRHLVRVRLRPPPLAEHKKAGNLNYAFRRTRGEHIVIFDADSGRGQTSSPRPSRTWTTPYVGIVQTPQFFRVSRRQSWVERAAGSTRGLLPGRAGVT